MGVNNSVIPKIYTVAKVHKLVKDGMENVIKLKVPIEAHIEAGKNWLDLEPYKH